MFDELRKEMNEMIDMITNIPFIGNRDKECLIAGEMILAYEISKENLSDSKRTKLYLTRQPS